jgi:hypothetical protein
MRKGLVILIVCLLLLFMETAASTSPRAWNVSTRVAFFLQPDSPHPLLVKKKKLSFFQRFFYKMIEKEIRKAMKQNAASDPDQLARQANLFGWLSFATLFFLPIASIPLGILAISKGSKALRHGTSLPRKARTGRTMGIVSLALFVIALTVVLITIAGLVLL